VNEPDPAKDLEGREERPETESEPGRDVVLPRPHSGPSTAEAPEEPVRVPRVGCPDKPHRSSIDAERAVGRFQVAGFAVGALIALAVVAFGRLNLVGFLIVLALWTVVVVFAFLFNERWPRLVWERTFYRVDETGIEIESGVWWRSVINVPRSRVQHTDVIEGPIARRYGLATLVIHTAGRSSSTVSLSGLERSVALGIRDQLAVDERRA